MAITNNFLIYDSSEPSDLDASIKHSKTNPLLFDKFSSKSVVTFDYKNVNIESFRNTLTEFTGFLINESIEGQFYENESFQPEVTAKRLYNSSDLYFICLLVNNCITRGDYTFEQGKTFRFVPNEVVQSLLPKFLSISSSNANNVRIISLEDEMTLFK